MNSARMLVSESRFGASFIPQIEIYEDGAIVAPSSALISLYSPDDSLVVDSRVAAINETTKRISATFTGGADGEIDSMAENWRLVVDYEIGSIADQANFLFDCCKIILENTVVDADLLKLHPNLAEDRFADQDNFSPQIERAFEDIKRVLKERGRRPSLLVDASQIRDLTITHALELIFFDFAKTTEDIWWNRYLKKAAQYSAELESLNLKYDSDETGSIDEMIRFGTRSIVR